MGKMRYLAILACGVLGAAVHAPAANVRYYQQNGVTYRETRQVIQRPTITTRYEQREQTVYRQELKTELQNSYQTCQVPVTEFRWVTRWHGRWNPFVEPYLSQDLVPVTHWESRTEVVQVPVARTNWIPEKRIVQVPVTTRRMVNQEVVNRVVVSAVPPSVAAAQRNGIGGVALLGSDPPRKGTGWQAARDTLRR